MGRYSYATYVVEYWHKRKRAGYVGQTNSPARRYDEHLKGIGARILRRKGVRVGRLIHLEYHTTRSAAMRRERELKRLKGENRLKYVGEVQVAVVSILRLLWAGSAMWVCVS